jgi:ElaB/YqjD/DUF883 family membrane-anchored ribosome-binding protein
MDEFETIKRQMDARRSSLSDKLEALENQVADSVQGVTDVMCNVTEVVESTVESVKDSVESVKDSVQETVGAVKQSFDVSHQMEQHPWVVLGGAFAVGFLAGKMLPVAAPSKAAPSYTPRANGHANGRSNALAAPTTAETTNGHHDHSWLHGLGDMLAPEVEKLKGLALGAVLGLARDYIVQSVPPQLGSQLSGTIDNITTKLGGQPIRVNVARSGASRSNFEYPDVR